MIRTLALVLMTAWLALSVSAEERRYALLIGNADYPAVVGSLTLPYQDVDRIRGALEQAGFAAEDIKVLKDGDQARMNMAIAEFSDRLSQDGPNAVGFFYYSGHGGSADASGVRQNYLIPARTPVTNASQLPILGVSISGLVDSLAAADAKAVFIVSDACRNTLPLASSKGGEADKGMVRVNARSGLFIAFATADGATAPDDGSFSTALASQIVRPGQTADRAFTLALREVANQRPGNRLPFSVDGLRGDICFAGCDAAPALIANDEQVALGQALSSTDPAVLEEFLQRFPNSHSIGYVETRLANLKTPDPAEDEKAAAALKHKQGCERGEMGSCYNLGIYYWMGYGVPKDLGASARFYNMACEGGVLEACFNLALNLKSASVEQPDYAEAMRLLGVACNGGLDRACRELTSGQ